MTRTLRRVGAAVAMLALWQLVSAVVLPRLAPAAATLMPPPLGVVVAFIDLLRTGDIVLHVLASLKRVIVAFAVAAATGVALGVAIGWWRRFGELVDPLVELVRPIPPLAWIPLAIIWFGIGDTQNMFIIFLGAFFPIVVNTIAGVRSVDRNLVWGALTLGGRRAQILREIILPGSFPLVVAGVRIGLGGGFMSLLAAGAGA